MLNSTTAGWTADGRLGEALLGVEDLGSFVKCWDALDTTSAGVTADGGFGEFSLGIVTLGSVAGCWDELVSAGWTADGKVGDAVMSSWVA